MPAHVPAPHNYRTCGASACKHMCQRPIFTAFAAPARAGTCASTAYLPHLRCQRLPAHVPAPHNYRTCGASACRHMCQRPIFTTLVVPAHASACASAQYLPHLRCQRLHAHVPAPHNCRICGASACKHMCQRPIITALAVPALASTCASAQYLPHLRCQRVQGHVPALHIYRTCGASAFYAGGREGRQGQVGPAPVDWQAHLLRQVTQVRQGLAFAVLGKACHHPWSVGDVGTERLEQGGFYKDVIKMNAAIEIIPYCFCVSGRTCIAWRTVQCAR